MLQFQLTADLDAVSATAMWDESDDADVKRFEGLTPDERDDLGFRLRAAKLRNDVGIE